jgi:malto-oligosyltrehalose synthase/4-alpha-glucanotransferase
MQMYNPVSTYRIQFNKNFTFTDAENIIPYLQSLNIKTIYASPVFRAVPDSMHGYDVTSPLEINPEIGTIDQLKNLITRLKSRGIGWVQDIVPNHMAYHFENDWLRDVMLNGVNSEFYSYFDLEEGEKIMAPFLGKSLSDEIGNGNLQIDSYNGQPLLKYYSNLFPINIKSAELRSLEEVASGHKTDFYLQAAQLDKLNDNPDGLSQILEEQNYRLCEWRETDHKINYRRFFTINGLICLNIHDENVFRHYHQLIIQLVRENLFDGLRVDHIDGLFDPASYLKRLKSAVNKNTYITVEKILQPNEELPEWNIEGNTGYDFLSIVNNLFTFKSTEKKFLDYYSSIDSDSDPSRIAKEKKRAILYQHMNGELDNLVRLFQQYSDTAPAGMRKAIGELLVAMPVYRFYDNQLPLDDATKSAFASIFTDLKKEFPDLITSYDLLEKLIDEKENQSALKFFMRCVQFSGPLMAKGIEDTFMYTYAKFIAHNEVGDSPVSFGIDVESFHEKMQNRSLNSPLSLNATQTHDTKRGEDSRARLNVLSEIPDHWFQKVDEWRNMNGKMKSENCPSDAEEYFLYQSIVGSFPLMIDATYENRLKEYMIKVLREAKINSGWSDPNAEYESNFSGFIDRLFSPHHSFTSSLIAFLGEINDYGIINSLAQLTLKITCPGTPDFYQGTDLFDLSFVDPDNRRPVDYDIRKKYSEKYIRRTDRIQLLNELWNKRNTGEIKQWLTTILLDERARFENLFAEGEYIPLKITGKYAKNIVAFARVFNKKHFITIVPIHLLSVIGNNETVIDWEDTEIHLPLKAKWKNSIDHREYSDYTMTAAELFHDFPVACLAQQETSGRSSGILLHISSLPSPFASGDFGDDAYRFVDFLHRNNQSYWQVLPFNPTHAESMFSPYSSSSSYAGNITFISPSKLMQDGFIDSSGISPAREGDGTSDFENAKSIRKNLLEKAFDHFITNNHHLLNEYKTFIEQNKNWLDDYALFRILKELNKNKSWSEWPADQKFRNKKSLDEIRFNNRTNYDYYCFQQFIFFCQWFALKSYANHKGISIVGDMPFYVNYDSADVWSHPGIFSLDDDLHIQNIAGVPPDYFSSTGQLWGMPTFNWKKLAENNYDWWIKRIGFNLHLFDVLRIDHFRAFDEYWEVPSGHKTAIHGKWIKGPGKKFFEILNSKIRNPGLIAEDLGDRMESVYKLRDEVNLPGMKVLTFAFGKNISSSVDAPHNYNTNFFVYTGTHDNNTIRGWYENEIDEKDRERIELYLGHDVDADSINEELIRVAFASVAKTVIIPMQDLLGLDESARMNTPGQTKNNWMWRMQWHQIDSEKEKMLKRLTDLYNRA